MFDATDPMPVLQRSRGAAHVVLGPRGLADLAQGGSAKAMLPRITAGLPQIMFLNTSGGLASGDRLSFAVTLRPDTRALATTQTAERAYRATGPAARAEVRLTVGHNGWLDWLPQETILFDEARLERDTTVDLAPGAGCLLLEMIVLGRLAMGECPRRLHLRDRRVVRRAGRIVHHDAMALDDAALPRLGGPDLLAPARAVLDEPGVTGAASAPPGRLVIRLLARDDWPLRRQVNRLLTTLRPDPLPRIWQV
jgi:urease accessory protein